MYKVFKNLEKKNYLIPFDNSYKDKIVLIKINFYISKKRVSEFL